MHTQIEGPTVINSGPDFTGEQKKYLKDFFAEAIERGAIPFAAHAAAGLIPSHSAFGLANQAAEAPEESYFGTPISDLCKEERWKYEENPLDIWDKLVAHADQDKAPAADDVFRFKFHGLFYVAPAHDSFMLRLRVPGAILSAHQLRGVAAIAAKWGVGRADITTRSNLQIRELKPKDIVRVLNAVRSLGMCSRGSGADNIRNITASPITGLDPTELYDVGPLAETMSNYILNSRDMYQLPRKFNIAFDNGGSISVLADTNDIGFVAVQIKESDIIQAGVYFRVLLCGITGHRQFAADCGILLRPEQTVAVAAAMIRVFTGNGDRTNRRKARLKYLVDRWGTEKFLAETEKRLAFPLLRVPADACEPRNPIDRSAHIGVHRQAQSGLHYIGISVPVGQLPTEQMLALAETAERHGTGELRLTVWQNIIIPNISSANLEAAKQAILAAGLRFDVGTVLAGTVACTGNKGCRFSATDTKAHARAFADHLDTHFKIQQPVNLHVTGCPHSCAQHYVGDIGLMGLTVGGEEAYQVVIGGGCDHDQGLARELISAAKFVDLTSILHRLFQAYTDTRNPEESFVDFARRHTVTELKSFCALPEE